MSPSIGLTMLLLAILPVLIQGMWQGGNDPQGGNPNPQGGNNNPQGIPMDDDDIEDVQENPPEDEDEEDEAANQAAYDEQTGFIRDRLRNLVLSDTCHCLNHPPFFGDKAFRKRTFENCQFAFDAFQGLPAKDRRTCPRIRRRGCLRCGTAVKRCGFYCDPTQLEIDTAYRNFQPRPTEVCKHLKNILGIR